MKPILFSTPMVQAILEGRKTQTRRVINPRYRQDEGGFQIITTRNGEFIRVEKVDENECGIFADGSERYVNPHYDVSDILWVRETFCYLYELDGNDNIIEGTGKYYYAADDPKFPFSHFLRDDGTYKDYPAWRPSIHMPKKAARLFLRVTDAHVEKVQDITFDNIIAEGIALLPEAYNDPDNAYLQARQQYAELWDSLNAKRGFGWEANPWVWVYEFEQTEKPQLEIR